MTSRIKKIQRCLYENAVDNTAMFAQTFPIFAATEIWGMKLTDTELTTMQSLYAKTFVAVQGYAGFGRLFTYCRDKSMRYFGVDSKSQVSTGVSDMAYVGAVNLLTTPLFFGLAKYYDGGGSDNVELAIQATVMGAVSTINAPFMFYAVDVFRDLCGTHRCNRPLYPDSIKKKTKIQKYTIATTLALSGLIATSGVYGAAFYLESENQNQATQARQTLEQKISEH